MQDLQFDFFDIPSPCRGVCKSDNKGYCQGCFRSREERFGWKELSNNEKQRVIKLCLQREKRRNAPIKVKVIEEELDDLQPSLLDPPTDNKIDNKLDDLDFEDFEL
ncbi:DUF1289 domain-containing protein [Thalassomonas sp. M1454]|uniref:DUF1289 domain-containing protein n=1 Tax=Thalassomonas sp. M1454 TaxID=2594477 RepID=UPI00117FDAAF|nr:DUF1289 domain-containing protein [Thalassomonas sp. M1454]TRX54009.1 DUF1289 domain-containing protein [Thalassomonas sp. M1454]